MTFPSIQQLEEIVDRTTQHDHNELRNVLDGERIDAMKGFVRTVPVAGHVKNYAARLVLATHPDSPYATDLAKRYVLYGSSPRGAQSLVLGGKMKALLDGRYNVSFDDIRTIAVPSLRHRIILNFEGAAAGIEQAQDSLRGVGEDTRGCEGIGTMARLLFDTEFLKKLEQLRITSNRIYHGQGRGEHSTVKIGTSLEFSDYRNYQVGDDFRYIDWNIFSRLDRLFLKVFTAEEDLSIHILLDTSQSMQFGIRPRSITPYVWRRP